MKQIRLKPIHPKYNKNNNFTNPSHFDLSTFYKQKIRELKNKPNSKPSRVHCID